MAEEQREKIDGQQTSGPQEEVPAGTSTVDEATGGEREDLLAKDEEIKQLKDKVLRIAAEMENTRKRLERERTEGISFANENLIREMLPVMDNLERAIQHAEQDAEGQSLLDGVRMTAKSFLDILAKFGAAPFESLGKPFDPKYHEAIMQQEAPDVPNNTVIQEYQKGYTLHDRLLRPAMVVVSKGAKGQQVAG